MGVIRDLILEQVEAGNAERDRLWLEAHRSAEPRLFISSLGGCVRKAFFDAYRRVEGHPWCVERTHPFDTYLLEKFKYGNDWEDITYRELLGQLPGRIVRNVSLGDSIWAGRADFLVGKCFLPEGAVIEHKTTATWSFTYSEEKRQLPYKSHCYQVLAYKMFLGQMTGLDIPAYLYYRSANNLWAEFEVYEFGKEVIFDGEIAGHLVGGRFLGRLCTEMVKFQTYWNAGKLPPRYETPTFVDFGCTKKQGRAGNRVAVPACQFFSICWPGVETPIEVGE